MRPHEKQQARAGPGQGLKEEDSVMGRAGWPWKQEPGKRCQIPSQEQRCISSLGILPRGQARWDSCQGRKPVTSTALPLAPLSPTSIPSVAFLILLRIDWPRVSAELPHP